MKHAFCALLVLVSCLCSASGSDLLINAHPDPKYGKPIPFVKVPGTAGMMSLEIANGKLYALEDNGVSIFDLSDPRNPKRLGHVGGMGNVRQLRISGKTAFLSSRQCGLWAVDISDAAQPKILSNFDGVEMATGLDVAGDIAFLGHRVYGVQCVDVSDPAKMKHLSSLRTDESQSVYYRNGLLLSGDWAGGEVTVIDVSDPLDPRAVSKIGLDGYGDGMCMRGDILFASTGQHKKSGPPELREGAGHGLDIFDVSNPDKPVRLSRVDFPAIYFGPCDYWTPRVSGHFCLASDTVNGVFLVDVSDLRCPKIAGNLVLPKRDPENPKIAVPYKQITDPAIPQGDPVSSIAVGDGVLYISGTFTGLYIAELPEAAKPEPRDFGKLTALPAKPFDHHEKGFISSGAQLSNPTRAVAINGDIAYAANVWEGVKIYRLAEGKIEQIGRADIPYAADIKRSGDRLYVAEGQNGIGVYQIVSDTALKEISRLKTLDTPYPFAQFVWAFEGHDVIAASSGSTRVLFIDFSDLASPKVLLSQHGSCLVYNNYGGQSLVKGKYFGFSRVFGGIQLFEIGAGSAKLIWEDTFPMCSQTGTLAAFGGEFLVMRCGGYAFEDPERPVGVRELKRYPFPTSPGLPADVPDSSAISRAIFPKSEFEGQVNADEATRRVAIANRMFKNIRVYDFSDRESPKLLKSEALRSNPNVPAFWKGLVVLPGGYSGLLLERGHAR